MEDENYVGLRQARVKDDRYDKLVQELFDSVVEKLVILLVPIKLFSSSSL